MSNLKKDIENVFLQYRAELKQGLNELAGHGTPEEQSATQIINLIESVIPEEDTRAFPGMGGPLPDSPVRETCYKQGWNECIADIKSKLIGEG